MIRKKLAKKRKIANKIGKIKWKTLGKTKIFCTDICAEFFLLCRQSACAIIRLYAGMAELADAPDLGSGGQPCRFKSCYPYQK